MFLSKTPGLERCESLSVLKTLRRHKHERKVVSAKIVRLLAQVRRLGVGWGQEDYLKSASAPLIPNS